jgi:hypothetical protein
MDTDLGIDIRHRRRSGFVFGCRRNLYISLRSLTEK